MAMTETLLTTLACRVRTPIDDVNDLVIGEINQ
jgi:hypothetical protein